VEQQFKPSHLQLFNDVEEFELEVDSAPSLQPHRAVLWVVTVDSKPYIRSVNGQHGHWYETLLATSLATIRTQDELLHIRAVPVSDDDTRAQVSREYLRKYAQYPQDAAWMVAPEVSATTLRLEPVA